MVFLTINTLVRMLGVAGVTGAAELAQGLSLGSTARITWTSFWDEPEAYKYRSRFWY